MVIALGLSGCGTTFNTWPHVGVLTGTVRSCAHTRGHLVKVSVNLGNGSLNEPVPINEFGYKLNDTYWFELPPGQYSVSTGDSSPPAAGFPVVIRVHKIVSVDLRDPLCK